MAAASNSFFGIRDEEQLTQHQPQQQGTATVAQSGSTAAKKKRNLPGTPNPDAEVIALSPKSLMATNRFICEVCQKGFQREQNLQLHRRGHNLPWKLRQKSTKEVRRKVYLCPEPTCVHHDPSRALGDLTGIKKHFSRKHGEKKWKCEKCSKKYAVQSDCKAHAKTCGTREYRCDCGTLFSRRDSFITHRAFCDALAQESARLPPSFSTLGNHLYGTTNAIGLNLSHQVNTQLSSLQEQNHSDLLRLGGGPTFDHLHPSPFQFTSNHLDFNDDNNNNNNNNNQVCTKPSPFNHGLMQLPHELQNPTSNSSPFNLSFFANENPNPNEHDQLMNNNEHPNNINDMMNDAQMSSMFNNVQGQEQVLPQMSATALLQKAAQMGATTSTNDQTQHINEIMNSFANGNSTMFGASMGFETGLCGVDERSKFERGLTNTGSISDGLTRDFLGVGSIMRGMGGGMQQQQHISLDSEFIKSATSSSSRSFAGTGSLQ